MSLTQSGTFTRSAGLISAIVKQKKLINLTPVKSVQFTFDPFAENIKSTREFLFYISEPKVRQTNLSCPIRTEIVCNRAEPTIVFQLKPDIQQQAEVETIKFKANNLTALELLQLYNKYITVLTPIEEPDEVIETKGKKQIKGGRRR